MADRDSIRVAIRVRPLVASEIEKGCVNAVERIRDLPQLVINKSDSFTFNHVFDENDTQANIYNESVHDMIDNLFKGYNVTILAYGQTGSGKTYTMGTAFDGDFQKDVGVIPRAINDIFTRIESKKGEYNFTVSCSFMELYQEQLFDLLSPMSRMQSVVDMREDKNGIILPGLTETHVQNVKETVDCLLRGSAGRVIGSTAMNLHSSRSHAIFTVVIHAAKKDDVKSLTVSKFHLVDLAGSERSKKTKATGDRFREGVKINQGLLALGNVISALGTNNGNSYIGYRDSKLTRLLQDSLGGNSVTLMIACISPADYNTGETISTLRYADRARKIKNKPIINHDPNAAEINLLKATIQKLRMELLSARGGISSSPHEGTQRGDAPLEGTNDVAVEMPGKLYIALQSKYRSLQAQLQATLQDLAENEMRSHINDAFREQLKTKMEEMKMIIMKMESDMKMGKSITMKQLEILSDLLGIVNNELEKTDLEIVEKCKSTLMKDSDEEDSSDNGRVKDMSALDQEQVDAFNGKQISIKDELKRVNRELMLKQELHTRVAENFKKFNTLDLDVEEKFKECATKIQELESERNQLLDKLKSMKDNVTAKLAEERRKRLQALEHEINDMKLKNSRQARMLQIREKEVEKIKSLNNEIHMMKATKVKLIRSMRLESENFRQWKILREKEVNKLKSKDRKMQNEMVRKEQMHIKQRNVLKRRCDEAMAINKRLKDALERQKVAQSMRMKCQSGKDISWIERELELIASLIDAENTLEQLMESRTCLCQRIEKIKQHPIDEVGPLSSELRNLREELEMQNAQIGDIQQKVTSTDVDAHIRTACDSMQNLNESRTVTKHLLHSIVDIRRDFASKFQDQKTSCEKAENRYKKAEKRIRQMETENAGKLAEREHAYEEKIAVLLRELHAKPQMTEGVALTPEQNKCLHIQQEYLDKMDAMRTELDTYKKLVSELQSAVTVSTKRKNLKRDIYNISDSNLLEISSDSHEIEDKYDKTDPDWRATPLSKRRREYKLQHSKTDKHSDTTSTLKSSTDLSTCSEITLEQSNHAHCKCRGSCSTRRCRCLANDQKCGLACRCLNASCCNGKGGDCDSDDRESKENQSDNIKAEDVGKPPVIQYFPPTEFPMTPTSNRNISLSFASASVKKKFFK